MSRIKNVLISQLHEFVLELMFQNFFLYFKILNIGKPYWNYDVVV